VLKSQLFKLRDVLWNLNFRAFTTLDCRTIGLASLQSVPPRHTSVSYASFYSSC
jgi:hypothetical protein